MADLSFSAWLRTPHRKDIAVIVVLRRHPRLPPITTIAVLRLVLRSQGIGYAGIAANLIWRRYRAWLRYQRKLGRNIIPFRPRQAQR